MASLLLGHGAWAGLEFQTLHLSHEADFEDTEFAAAFHFTATGKETIEIRDVRSSCGCTVPSLAKKKFAPGESGEISVVFSYGARVGVQHKSVFIETTQGQIELTLEVTIPRRWEANTRTLFWGADEEREPKLLTVKFNHAVPIIFDGLADEPNEFAHSEGILSADGSVLTVAFTPVATEPTGIHRVEVKAKGSAGQEFRIPVYLRAL